MKWLVTVLLASLLVAGCAGAPVAGTPSPVREVSAAQPVSGQPASAAPQASEISVADRRELEVVETGFSSYSLPYSAGVTRTVAVTVRNPNPTTWTASGVDLTLTVRDAAGGVIPFDERARIETIPPGATRAYAYTKEGFGPTATATVARVDATVAPGTRWLRPEEVAPGSITTGRATGRSLKARGLNPVATLEVVCDATSTLPVKPKLFTVVVLFRDGRGALTGGDRMYSSIDRTEFVVAPNAGTRIDVEVRFPPLQVPPSVECVPDHVAPEL